MLILAFNDQRFIHLPSYYRARGTTADSTIRKRADVQEALNRLSATESRAWGIKRFLDYVAARDEVCVPVCVCVRARVGSFCTGRRYGPGPALPTLLAYSLCSRTRSARSACCLLPALPCRRMMFCLRTMGAPSAHAAWHGTRQRSVQCSRRS